jgi:hypothetical protein
MEQHEKIKPSDYRSRGFTQLHIKRGTKNRMNIAKATFTASMGRVVTHDDLINHLLDSHIVTKHLAPASEKN